jgi:hypothetical protein
MDMGIDESRQHRGAAEIDDILSGQPVEFAVEP